MKTSAAIKDQAVLAQPKYYEMDGRDAMIRDIVRARNRYAHGLYETNRP